MQPCGLGGVDGESGPRPRSDGGGGFARLVMVGVLLVAGGPMVRSGPAARADGGSLVFAIGDSLTIGMSPYLPSRAAASGWAGIRIDAFKSRGIRTKVGADPTTGLGAVTSMRQRFGDTDSWIVALGTNDAGFSSGAGTQLIREMLDAIGPGHRVLWVNVHLPRTPGVQQAWNTALNQVAAERPDQLFVLDWASIAARQTGIMAFDGVHLTAGATRSWRPPSPPRAKRSKSAPRRSRLRPWARSSLRAACGAAGDSCRRRPSGSSTPERPSPSPPVRSCRSTSRDGFRSARWPRR